MTPYLQQRALLFQPLSRKPSSQLGLVIVIPACREEHLLLCLMALQRCTLPDCDVDIIVVIHDSEADTPEARARNLSIGADAERWAARHNSTRRWFHIVYHCGMPRRDAGPELARKIGLDEACRRLEQAGNPQGVIVCLDADARCSTNYLCHIEQYFLLHPLCPAASIRFEYPIHGAEFDPEVYQAGILYELQQRYLAAVKQHLGVSALGFLSHSAMAVRCRDYQSLDGISHRELLSNGHLLQKWSASPYLGHITETCITLSPRPATSNDAVAGRAIRDALRRGGQFPTPPYPVLESLKNEGIPPEKWLDVARKRACPLVSVERAAGEFWERLTGSTTASDVRTLIEAYRSL